MDPLRGEGQERVPYLIGAVPFGGMILVLTWALLPLIDFEMDGAGKIQWTAFALFAIGFAAVADHRSRGVEPGEESRPIRVGDVELRPLRPNERKAIPAPLIALALFLPFAFLLVLGDSWVGIPLAVASSGLLSLAMARYAQNNADPERDSTQFATLSRTPQPLSAAGVAIVTVGVIILIVSIVAVFAGW